MSNEHNPVAMLVSRLQEKWIQEVSPVKDLKLVRWIVKPGHHRLYEGFLRLESSENGKLPETCVTLLTSFESGLTHSSRLIADWIENFRKHQEVFDELKSQGFEFFWDVRKYEALLDDSQVDKDQLLHEMLYSFQQALPDKEKRLVLSLFPYQVSSPREYNQWINQILKAGIPDKILFMLFDFSDIRCFDKTFEANRKETLSLLQEIDMEGAMAQIASSGDAKSPEVKFRKCMLEMSQGIKANSLTRVQEWGKKGVEVAQATGNKQFFSTAHLVYAGMLFHFKSYEEIRQLLQQGLRLAEQGLAAGDKTCEPQIILAYGYMAGNEQLKGKWKEAADLYIKQGDFALKFKQGPQALSAWWQAYELYRKKNAQMYNQTLSRAWNLAVSLDPEQLESSCFSYIAFDYFELSENTGNRGQCEEIDRFTSGLMGEDWKLKVQQYKADSKKKKRFLFV